MVGTLWHGTVHALFLLGAGDFGENHLLPKQGFDFVLNETELVKWISPNGDIEAKTEELFCTNLEFVTEFFGIVDGSFEFWVADFAFFGVDIVAGFKLSNLFAEVFHDDGSFYRVNIHWNIKYLVDVDEAGNPTSIEGAGVTIDIDSTTIFGAETEIGRMNFDRAWWDKIA